MENQVKCYCRHCGTELPPSHLGPCPRCGKSGKDCKVSAFTAIGLVVSSSAQKVHKYVQKHPWFISISIVLTVIALTVGYLLDSLVGLLIGIIVAILNWWITPHAMKTIVEITQLGDNGKETEKVKNNTKQTRYSNKDIYGKLETIEYKVDSSNLTQKFGILYALGASFIILGLSYLAAFYQKIGIDTAKFYSINIPGLLALGTFLLVYALQLKRGDKRKVQLSTKKAKEKKL